MARKNKIPAVKLDGSVKLDEGLLNGILRSVGQARDGLGFADLGTEFSNAGVGAVRKSIGWLRSNGYLAAEGNTRAMKYRLA